MKRLFVLLLFISQTTHARQHKAAFTDYVQPAVFSLSMVMMHDVTNPPAATRFYSYCTMAAYSIVAARNKDIPGAAAFIKSYPAVTVNDSNKLYDYKIAAVYSILETGRLLLPSGFMLEKDEERLLLLFRKDKVPEAVIRASVSVAEDVANQMVRWSRGDGYGKLSAHVRYTPVKGDGYWYPTPPAYIEAVEPYWKTIRPMLIDSCNQFLPLPPVPFSKDTTSKFYALNKEVCDTGKNLSMDQRVIASFWDCNPFAVSTYGHMAIGFKKITPGGHWMNITGIAARKAQLDFDKTIMAHALAAVTMMDAFICCWDAKYLSNRIRPETYINRYIDIRWKPLLQTPPFPEYTSGHSVVSTAAAAVLTYLFGDNFAYADNSEEMFEIPTRNFSSFKAASQEAAISRLYGGIHFRDAIDNGVLQGQQIGAYIVGKMQAAGIKPVYSSNHK